METKTEPKIELFKRLTPLLQLAVDETVKEQLAAAALSLNHLDPFHATPEMANYLILLEQLAKTLYSQNRQSTFVPPELLFLFNAVSVYMQDYGQIIHKIASGKLTPENTPEFDSFLIEYSEMCLDYEKEQRDKGIKPKVYHSVKEMFNDLNSDNEAI